MKTELAKLHYQAYKLAFDLAKRAEKAFQHERGDNSQSFIQFGYWDSLKKGLLAGERLLQDLRRMDATYHAENKRELELVKMVSLAEHDPDELVKLRQARIAEFSLTEDDYDRDFPDHYLRRLKSIAVTIPCTSGPYQGVHGTLEIHHGATRPGPKAVEMNATYGPIQSMATSQAQMDTGVFEMSFRDERLLPFEGLGAHRHPSTTGKQIRFELTPGNRFDLRTLDDLVLDVRYTARRGRTEGVPTSGTRTLKRLIRVRHEFRTAWALFKEGSSDGFVLELPESSWRRGGNEQLHTSGTVTNVTAYAWFTPKILTGTTIPAMTLAPPVGSATEGPGGPVPATDTDYTQWGSGAVGYTFPTSPDSGEWTVGFTSPPTAFRDNLEELWVVLTYTVTIV